jgi:hypothetical protein
MAIPNITKNQLTTSLRPVRKRNYSLVVYMKSGPTDVELRSRCWTEKKFHLYILILKKILFISKPKKEADLVDIRSVQH